MKVVVLGGYGVFGSRLVDLLDRDEHQVVVAGRSQAKADAFVDGRDLEVIVCDRAGDLSPIWDAKPDIVVDAAGPFHAYGNDPYLLARGCIANGAHYLDLADDPAFCTGISQLDAAAKGAGVFVLSGASSVPALSSAIVADLAGEADAIEMIDTAILPGNRAPRGRAVVESILNQCGMPFETHVAGERVERRSWSGPRTFDLGQGLIRKGWLMEVPDTRLFGEAFDAQTVKFRAGMELPVMNHALAVISWLRGRLGFGIVPWFVSLLLWIAACLKPFGTDVGGMSVAVTARDGALWRRRTWRLVAQAGEGPFIPAVAARAILRDPKSVGQGARPAVGEVTREAVEAAMNDLAVTTEVVDEEITPLFPRFLGRAFADLPDVVQAGHLVPAPLRLTGRARVTRGPSLWARFLAALFRFPVATDDIAVSVLMTPDGAGETWERRFGEQTFQSHLRIKGTYMTERFGPFTFRLGLHVAEGALHFPVLSGRLGPVPLPRFLLPVSEAREFAKDGRFNFDVRLSAPLTGALMVHYQGWLEPVAAKNLRFSNRDQQRVDRPGGGEGVHDLALQVGDLIQFTTGGQAFHAQQMPRLVVRIVG
ncbi:DUF4166 domain-containing protein [Cognatiyoonia sp. IB215446]|uniref:DUF4166 domain-containing protein n=1 Tax=Cognatiyoonia sp. IB215446 TaxID=3097355 RepID=UPI002A0FEA0C|nr:DUF4166 domain-containing protein [Cognatiyoonia sp. IB215446]MDX8347654.1 DUF4166 domain-containing protein [Cognatiyoonia sp. IB215446]